MNEENVDHAEVQWTKDCFHLALLEYGGTYFVQDHFAVTAQQNSLQTWHCMRARNLRWRVQLLNGTYHSLLVVTTNMYSE